VTRESPAYPAVLRGDAQAGLHFVEAGRPDVLAERIDQFAAGLPSLVSAGDSAQRVYQQYFSNASVRYALAGLLTGMDLPVQSAQ
jgi:hypothetical protein